MGRADVAAGHKKVGNIRRIHYTVGNAVRRGHLVENRMLLFGGRRADARRGYGRPSAAAEGNHIVKFSAGLDIILRQHDTAFVTAGLALAGQEPNPLKYPILAAVVAAVLDMIPNAESHFQQLVAQTLSIVDTVILAAQLHPPQIAAAGADFVVADGNLAGERRNSGDKIVVAFIDIGPIGGDKGNRTIGFAGL